MENQMSKQANEDAPPKAAKKIKVLSFTKDALEYGYVEWEIDPAILKKHGKQLSKINPDLFAIFLSQLQRKLREIFEI